MSGIEIPTTEALNRMSLISQHLRERALWMCVTSITSAIDCRRLKLADRFVDLRNVRDRYLPTPNNAVKDKLVRTQIIHRSIKNVNPRPIMT